MWFSFFDKDSIGKLIHRLESIGWCMCGGNVLDLELQKETDLISLLLTIVLLPFFKEIQFFFSYVLYI